MKTGRAPDVVVAAVLSESWLCCAWDSTLQCVSPALRYRQSAGRVSTLAPHYRSDRYPILVRLPIALCVRLGAPKAAREPVRLPLNAVVAKSKFRPLNPSESRHDPIAQFNQP